MVQNLWSVKNPVLFAFSWKMRPFERFYNNLFSWSKSFGLSCVVLQSFDLSSTQSLEFNLLLCSKICFIPRRQYSTWRDGPDLQAESNPFFIVTMTEHKLSMSGNTLTGFKHKSDWLWASDKGSQNGTRPCIYGPEIMAFPVGLKWDKKTVPIWKCFPSAILWLFEILFDL